jgi:hypothetical protein
MISKEVLTKVVLGILIVVVLSVVINLLNNIYKSIFKRSEIITLDCKNIGTLDISKHIDNMKRRNPELDDKTLRLLYFAFRAVVMGYGKYSDNVVLCESHDPDKNNEKVNIKISEKKTENVDTEILSRYEKEKSEGSPKFKEELLTFSFEDVNGEMCYKLSDQDKYIITSNESVIFNLIAKSEINFDQELSNLLAERNIKIVDDSYLMLSPLEIMFSKYVRFFILKL